MTENLTRPKRTFTEEIEQFREHVRLAGRRGILGKGALQVAEPGRRDDL
jgi:hypothetical protein